MNLRSGARVRVHCLLASHFLLTISELLACILQTRSVYIHRMHFYLRRRDVCIAVVALHRAGADSGSAGGYNEVGVPLPEFCNTTRGDRTVNTTCNEGAEKVTRYFFHHTKHCKKFGVCPTVATYLDQQADPTINYFQNSVDCEEACTNGKCSTQPNLSHCHLATIEKL